MWVREWFSPRVASVPFLSSWKKSTSLQNPSEPLEDLENPSLPLEKQKQSQVQGGGEGLVTGFMELL